MTNKTVVYRAGLIPYIVERGDIIKMMFMKPSDTEYGGDCFQIAKGKVEDNESHQSAAIREAAEELGLFKGNILRTEEVGVFMGRTTLFVSKIKNVDLFGQPSFETSDTTWMTLEEFLDQGRDLHKPVVRAAYRKILSMEGIEQ